MYKILFTTFVNFILAVTLVGLASTVSKADVLVNKSIDLTEQISLAKLIANADVIKERVLKHNLSLPSELRELDNVKWKKLSVRDPIINEFLNNAAALYLKKTLPSYVSEAFISGKDGKKVAFIKKTTFWDHTGKDKHEEPMKKKVWQGKTELDESTGTNQIQIAVPIIDKGMAVGSLVLGISVAELGLLKDAK